MIPTSDKPNLRQIGERACIEVLGTFLSLPATVQERPAGRSVSAAPDEVSGRVPLTGSRLSGSVHLQLPRAFVANAVRFLTGLDAAAGHPNELQDDAAGELANMVAGRVASQLAAAGYPCTLGTPSVSRDCRLAAQNQDDVSHGRTELICDGHWLSLEIQCCYTDP